jgi:hypothetical protein
LIFLILIAFAIVTATSLTPIVSTDQSQPRLNQAAPIPRGAAALTQTFTARHNGLSSVELLAVVYPDAPATGTLTVQLWDAQGNVVAAADFAQIRHNTPLSLNFAPQANSAGQTYVLRLSGTPDNAITAWAYSLDGYARGELRLDDSPLLGDLCFITHYTYLWPDVLADAWAAMLQLARWLVVLWLILFAPGWLALSLMRIGDQDAWTRWGLALALSLALLPLAWQWLTMVGGRWIEQTLWVAFGIIGILAVLLATARWRNRPTWRWHLSAHDLGLLTVLAVGLLARFLAARDLAFPAWVDSPHHAFILRVLEAQGQMPRTYDPLLPDAPFTYHFGYHVAALAFYWCSDLSLPDSMLILGNVLNGLMPLSTYTFVATLTGRRRAGLFAAWFVAFVSLFPAYYLTWGRYTQLVGLLILAPLLAAAWELVRIRPHGSLTTSPWALVGLIALLAGGLVLTHYRILIFFVIFSLVALAAGRAGGWRWLGAAALLTLTISAPWLWQLTEPWFLPAVTSPALLASPEGYNDFPWAYFNSQLERGWLIAAGVFALWGLLRRERLIWGVVGWVAVTFALLNLGPGSWLVNNNSWAISLFLPGAFLLGWGLDEVWSYGERWAGAGPSRVRRLLGAATLLALAVVLGTVSALGLRAQVAVLNPQTVLADADDRAALEWVAQNIPPEAVFANNAWNWQLGTWAGSDGGTWLWPWLGLSTTTPPLDYIYDPALAKQVVEFNQQLAKRSDANSPDALALFREAGVTHIFIGARGGSLKPEMFVGSPHYRLLYSNGAAWVFAFEPKP